MSSVDVIIPCYRYGRFLRECVESVLAQGIADLRVLIIDDASPDNTEEVAQDLVRSDPRVALLRHPRNRGHITTYNEGLDWAEADYLLLLSADDYLLPGALHRALALMEADSAIGFTFGNYLIHDQLGETVETRILDSDRIFDGRQFIRFSGSKNVVSTATAVVRTRLQKRVGGYLHELPHSGDMEMWLRLASHASVGFIAAYQAVYRRHDINMSLGYQAQRSILDLQQRKACFDTFFAGQIAKLDDPQLLRRELTKSLALDAISLASSAFNDADLESSDQFSNFAAELFPQIRNSLSWKRLTCKRMVGTNIWNLIAPAVTRLRPRLALRQSSVDRNSE